MSAKLEMLSQNLQTHFGDKLKSLNFALGEVTIEVGASDYLGVMAALRNEADLQFEELVDLCGVDYSTYGEGAWQGRRFAAVTHLLSIQKNWRLRVRVFARGALRSNQITNTPELKPILTRLVFLGHHLVEFRREFHR